MAPPSVAQSVRLAVAGLRGQPTGREDELIVTVRARLNARLASPDDLVAQTTAYVYGMEPVIHYLAAACGREVIDGWSRDQLGDHVYKIFELVVHRTRLLRRYSPVLENYAVWNQVTAGLVHIRGGGPVAPPSLGTTAPAPVPVAAPWWSARWAVVALLWLIGGGLQWIRPLFGEGRSRFWITMTTSFLWATGGFYYRWGPANLPSWITRTPVVTPPEEDGEASDATGSEPGTDSASGGGLRVAWDVPEANTEPAPDPMARLAAQVEALTASVASMARPSPEASSGPQASSSHLATLVDFATGEQQAGPISHTAARQASEGVPIRIAPILESQRASVNPGTVGWAPFAGRSQASEQAGRLVNSFDQWYGQRLVNPHWGVCYWQDVTALSQSTGIEPDLMRLLQTHGYSGPHSVGVPRVELRSQLENFRTQAAPALGTVNFGAPPGLAADLGEGIIDGRWEDSLPVDMKRAAPTIYRNLRAEGASNIREWLNLRYVGDKSPKNKEWSYLWGMASEIDFKMARIPADARHHILSTDDGMEIKLRHLAATFHLSRTGDLTSAANMLAVRAPGTATEVAPDWLVEETTNLSKQEHATRQRVGKGKGKRDEWEKKDWDKKEKKGKGKDKGKDKGG